MENTIDDQVVKTEITEAVSDNQPAITEDVNTENLIPQSRFNEVNDKMKTYAEQVSAYEKAEEDAKTKILEDQGRYDEIIAKKDNEIDRLTKVEGRFILWETERKTELLSLIPEDERVKFTHLNVEDLVNITKTFVKDEHRANVDTSRASARESAVKPFSAKHNDKAQQKDSWADKLKSYR